MGVTSPCGNKKDCHPDPKLTGMVASTKPVCADPCFYNAVYFTGGRTKKDLRSPDRHLSPRKGDKTTTLREQLALSQRLHELPARRTRENNDPNLFRESKKGREMALKFGRHVKPPYKIWTGPLHPNSAKPACVRR